MSQERSGLETNGYDIKEISLRGAEGFRVALFNGNELVATRTQTRVVNLDEFPGEAKQIIAENDALGIPTFFVNTTVVDKFQGKGFGSAIRREAQARLLAKYPIVIELVVDDSVSPTSNITQGWTKRRVKNDLANKNPDYETKLIYEGELGNRPAWLIKYHRKVVRK